MGITQGTWQKQICCIKCLQKHVLSCVKRGVVPWQCRNHPKLRQLRSSFATASHLHVLHSPWDHCAHHNPRFVGPVAHGTSLEKSVQETHGSKTNRWAPNVLSPRSSNLLPWDNLQIRGSTSYFRWRTSKRSNFGSHIFQLVKWWGR